MARGHFGFGHPLFRSAARAHLAGRQVERSGSVAHLCHADQGAAASLLDIVRMGGDCQNIEAHARAASFLRKSSMDTLYLKALRPSIAITGTSSLYIGSHSGWRSISISSNSKAAWPRAAVSTSFASSHRQHPARV